MAMGMGAAQRMRRRRSAGEISTCLGVADEALWQRRAEGTLLGAWRSLLRAQGAGAAGS